jgi:hypothetical protein
MTIDAGSGTAFVADAASIRSFSNHDPLPTLPAWELRFVTGCCQHPIL